MKIRISQILIFLGPVASIIMIYFTIINRMYIWTLNYFIAIIAISFYNFIISGIMFLKYNTKYLKISILGFILSLIPFIYYVYNLYNQFSY